MALHSPESGSNDANYNRSWAAINRLMRSGLSWSGNELDTAFINLGEGRFADLSHVAGLASPDDGRGAAPIDWDGDGDLDLWLNFRSGPRVRLMRNDTEAVNHFLEVRLRGTTSNRDAIGARVEVRTANGADYIGTVRAGNNYKAQPGRTLHFGLGADAEIESITVRWPDRSESLFRDVAVDSRLLLLQGSDAATALDLPRETQRLEPSPLQSPAPSSVVSIPLAQRITLPDTVFETLHGETVRLSEFAGRPIFINFWASWCAPCVSELRTFAEEGEILGAGDLAFIALSVDAPEDRSAAQQLIDELAPWFASGVCPDELQRLLEALNPVVCERYEPLPLPASILVDAEGRIARLYLGPAQPQEIAEHAGMIDGSQSSVLEHIAMAPGIWHAPEIALNHARWHRLLALTGELVHLDSYEVAALYAEELGELLATDPPQDTRETVVMAMARVAGGLRAAEPERAAALGRAIVAAEPENSAFLRELTNSLIAIGTPESLDEAASTYDRAISLAPPTTADEYATIGGTWLRMGQTENAISSLREARALDPEEPATAANLGLALIGGGNDAEGAPLLESALEELPDEPSSELMLAQAFDRIGDPDRAMAHYVKHLQLAEPPATAAEHVQRAEVHIRLGQWFDAADQLQAGLDLAPDDPEIKWQLGAVLVQLGRPEPALYYLTGSIDERPPSARDRYLLGSALAMSGQHERAVDEFQRALENDPQHAFALRGLAITRSALGQWPEAIEGFKAYLDVRPGDTEMMERLALAYEQAGQAADAAATLRKILEQDPQHVSTAMRLAMFLASAGEAEVRDGEEALRLAERLQEQIGRGSPFLLDIYAAACAELGRFDEAVQHAEEAVRLARETGDADLAASIQSRLDLYRANKPFRRE